MRLILGWEDPTEVMATHFRILDWRIHGQKATVYRVTWESDMTEATQQEHNAVLVP